MDSNSSSDFPLVSGNIFNNMKKPKTAIIPNMKAMLNRMPDMAQAANDMLTNNAPITQAAKDAMAQMSTQSSVEQKLDILNQTMLQLVNINTVHARTGEKTLKQTRSVGNLMGSIGRA